jgi:hypothetical protein
MSLLATTSASCGARRLAGRIRFSGRVVKKEVKEEEVVKQEDSEVVMASIKQEEVVEQEEAGITEPVVKTETTRKRIKREPADDSQAVKVEKKTEVVRRSKRQRV